MLSNEIFGLLVIKAKLTRQLTADCTYHELFMVTGWRDDLSASFDALYNSTMIFGPRALRHVMHCKGNTMRYINV